MWSAAWGGNMSAPLTIVGACTSSAGSASDLHPATSATCGSVPVDVSNDWDTFYEAWVKPVAHFGVPTLIVFAVLLTLSVIVTPLLVDKDTPGVRSGGRLARGIMRGMYWFGVLCLLFASIEAAVVYPVARNVRTAPWAAGVAIGLAAIGFAVSYTLFRVFDREWPGRIRVGHFLFLVVGGILICLLVGVGHLRLKWLNEDFSPMVYAVLLSVTGIVIASRVRGVGIGMLIKGHNKDGGDDAGLGAFVQARLYSLGSQRPSGILITQQTDVSTLPSNALSLIPDGTLAKLAALFMALFTPATPWRVDIAEQFDHSIIVSVRRNGAAAETTVIRASTLGLPAQPSDGANATANPKTATQVSGTSSDSPGAPGVDSDTASDWTAELRTAAAAFVLLALAKRYYHLAAGLSGATQWQSVAQQVIASEPTSQVNAGERRYLLLRAMAHDSRNRAAELAFLSTTYRTAASPSDHHKFATRFTDLLEKIHGQDGYDAADISPLELRVRFNLMAAFGNYATSLYPDGDVKEACDALAGAAEQAKYLLSYKNRPGGREETLKLWESMRSAIYSAGVAIRAESSRWPGPAIAIKGIQSALPGDVNISLLARYENACALTRSCVGTKKAEEYEAALDELEIAVAEPSQRIWARTDPSLAELHDVDVIAATLAGHVKNSRSFALPGARRDSGQKPSVANKFCAEAYQITTRFKELIGEAVPSDFLALSPFVPYRDALGLRGVHYADQLGRIKINELVSELGITLGEATRWLVLTQLHQWLAEASRMPGQVNDLAGCDQRATKLMFLLLIRNLDSVAIMRRALRDSRLKEYLLSEAQSWAVVAPGIAEVSTWQKPLRRRAGGLLSCLENLLCTVKANTTED